MSTIDWGQYGLKANPYSTRALTDGGYLAIDQAFVGRKAERQSIADSLANDDRLCLVISGNVGVGKTSLANFVKFSARRNVDKPLFSSRREIEASMQLLDKQSFLLEIIATTLREIELVEPDLLKNDKTLGDLKVLIDISKLNSYSFGLDIMGYGLTGSREKAVSQPLALSMSALLSHFDKLLAFIKLNEIGGVKHDGLIIHVNNFDVVLSESGGEEKIKIFFNAIRDFLLLPDLYFLFLGPSDLFPKTIATNQRLKPVFQHGPLPINPLSKAEIVAAFRTRMELLQSPDVSKYVNPVEDSVVHSLYDLYEGDIRQMMGALKAIVERNSTRSISTLTKDEALFLLGQERMAKIVNQLNLKTEQLKVLDYIIESDVPLCQDDLSMKFKKPQSNISGYYLKPLKEFGVIEEKGERNRKKMWGLTNDYTPLRFVKLGEKLKQREKAAKLQAKLPF